MDLSIHLQLLIRSLHVVVLLLVLSQLSSVRCAFGKHQDNLHLNRLCCTSESSMTGWQALLPSPHGQWYLMCPCPSAAHTKALIKSFSSFISQMSLGYGDFSLTSVSWLVTLTLFPQLLPFLFCNACLICCLFTICLLVYYVSPDLKGHKSRNYAILVPY